MDLLHRPDEYPFISAVVDVRKFFDEGRAFKEGMITGGGPFSTKIALSNAELANELGCSEETIAGLEELCDVEKLKCGLEDNGDPVSSNINPEGPKSLMTLEIQQRELQKRKEKLSYRQMACQLHKYRRTNFQVLDAYRDSKEAEEKKIGYLPPDVIMSVSMAKPYNRVLEHHEIRLGRLLSMDSVFYVLGNTRLSELRDKISCLCDWSAMHDCSETPDGRPHLAKDVYKSGFFYINGTFYIDMREGCFDLSEPIRQWAIRRSEEVGPFETASLEGTRFIDLKLRFGQPYVYVHQGTCEHLMVFGDLRMLSSTDAQAPTDYPMQISLKPKKRVACCGCKVYTARWVVYNNSDTPFDPSFFCDVCYRSFHYDEDGKKTSDFEAAPYYDRSILP